MFLLLCTLLLGTTLFQTGHSEDLLLLFLEEHSLEQYHECLVDNGADSVDDLFDLDIEELEELGISKKLHRKRLIKVLKKLQQGDSSLSASAQPAVEIQHQQQSTETATKPNLSVVAIEKDYEDLWKACSINKHNTVKQLLQTKNFEINRARSNGKNCLWMASGLDGSPTIVGLLLKYPGIKVDYAHDGSTEEGANLETAEGLKKAGEGFVNMLGDVFSSGLVPESMTALMHAASAGQVEIAKMLINSGADINYKSDGFDTPLTLSVEKGHKAMVGYLISVGADVQYRQPDEKQMFRSMHPHMLVKALNSPGEDSKNAADIINLLFDAGATWKDGFKTIQGSDESMIMYYAIKRDTVQGGHATLTKVILKHGGSLKILKEPLGSRGAQYWLEAGVNSLNPGTYPTAPQACSWS